jgi:biotin carboxyl carrier protein
MARLMARESLRLQFGAQTFSATRDLSPGGPVRISIGNDAAFEVLPLGNSYYRVTPVKNEGKGNGKKDGSSSLAVCATDDHQHWVFLDGEAYLVEIRGQIDARRRTTAGTASLAAPMPATVIKIMVAPGDPVRKGQTLLVLEAMKMEMPVKAPIDGIVKKLNCEPNQLVQPDVQLIELEPV